MKTVRVAFTLPEAYIHPMHKFVCQSSTVECEVLLERTYGEETRTHLFYVEGAQQEYERRLSAQSDITEYEITDSDDAGFYTYVHGPVREPDRDLFQRIDRETVVISLPIEFRSDRTMRLSLVGPSAGIQSCLDGVPSSVSVDVKSISASTNGTGDDLTDRQRDALATAWDCGYFSVPRTGTIDEVAEELDCAVSTASALIRRGERALVDRELDSIQ